MERGIYKKVQRIDETTQETLQRVKNIEQIMRQIGEPVFNLPTTLRMSMGLDILRWHGMVDFENGIRGVWVNGPMLDDEANNGLLFGLGWKWHEVEESWRFDVEQFTS